MTKKIAALNVIDQGVSRKVSSILKYLQNQDGGERNTRSINVVIAIIFGTTPILLACLTYG